MKIFAVVFLTCSILMGSAFGSLENTLPNIPDDCFDEEVFCHNWEVLKKRNPNNPHGKRVIRINFFAEIDGFEFDSFNDLVGRFINFDAWPEYTKNSENIKMSFSKRLPSIVDENGEVIHRHEAHYTMKGPRIIGGKVNVRELALYKQIPLVEDAVASWALKHDKGYEHVGIKHKTGVLHLTYDEDSDTYKVYIVLDVIPEINILPKVAAPYTEAGLVDTFKGMFNLL